MKYLKDLVLFSGLLSAILFALAYLGVAFFIGSSAEKETKTKSDVILVLGARSYIDNKYNPCLVARVKHAAELYKADYAPKLLVSGGYDKEDNASEAETMKKIAMENGVPSSAILLEKNSTSTYENFVLSKPILEANKFHSVIIITEPFHVARASLVAQKLGIASTVSPATDSPCWQPWKYASKYFVKEPFAIAAYKLQSKL